MKTVYVGLDLGSSRFQQAALDQEGVITMNRSFPTSGANLRAAFAQLHGEIHVHLEAGELVHDLVASLEQVAHHGTLKRRVGCERWLGVRGFRFSAGRHMG